VPDLSHPVAAFGLGIALGASPGPVQILLFSESTRGGVGRGLKAMAGATATFGLLLAALAAGLSSTEPGDAFLRVVKVVGGAFLVWIAIDSLREVGRPRETDAARPGLHPSFRGIIAVLLNPGVYIFLATTGAAVVAGATRDGGSGLAFLTVGALLAGVSIIDMGMVLLGGGGARRMGDRAVKALGYALGTALAALGIWLIVQGLG
jgi:threonine/homoserine/homoserine lactone efflux protein